MSAQVPVGQVVQRLPGYGEGAHGLLGQTGISCNFSQRQGSFIIGTRIFIEPKVGDIIVFEKDGSLLVKRIAAGPGDTVDLSQLVYMAAVPIPVREETVLTVPDGCYIVLGDNVQNSWDSRYWENPYVDVEDIVAIIKP